MWFITHNINVAFVSVLCQRYFLLKGINDLHSREVMEHRRGARDSDLLLDNINWK